MYDWNEVAPHSEPERLLHELFEDQAERIPDNVALVLDDEKLTYRELNARADDLVQHLRELGVRPETLVGLFMERSIEMVIAVLGILKSGGAYVPLDIEHPKERLAFMLDDARPPVLLTQRRLIDRLPELKAAQAVCIDELSSRDGARVQSERCCAFAPPRGKSGLRYLHFRLDRNSQRRGRTRFLHAAHFTIDYRRERESEYLTQKSVPPAIAVGAQPSSKFVLSTQSVRNVI